jgi:hypothetical protein
LASLVDIDNSSRGGLGSHIGDSFDHNITAAVCSCVAVIEGEGSCGSSDDQCRSGDDAELHDWFVMSQKKIRECSVVLFNVLLPTSGR